MIDNEVQKKLLDFLIKDGWHIGDGLGDVCSGYDDEEMEASVKRLENLCDTLYSE